MHKSECPVKKTCDIDGCEKCHHKLLRKKLKQDIEKELNATVQSADAIVQCPESTYF
jgi:hypothetical protein